MDTKYLEIIKAPVITEKSGVINQNGKYVFKVDHRASKTEIKMAIEKIFNVHVKAIQTITVKPKKKRVGRYSGFTNRAKKAIVTLAEGEDIKLD